MTLAVCSESTDLEEYITVHSPRVQGHFPTPKIHEVMTRAVWGKTGTFLLILSNRNMLGLNNMRFARFD